MVDEEDAPSQSRPRRLFDGRHRRAWSVDGVEERRGLQLRFALLFRGVGVIEKGRPHAHLRDSVLHADRPEGEARVQVAVEADEADGANIPDCLSLPDELRRREGRLAAIARAKGKIETRAAERPDPNPGPRAGRLEAKAASGRSLVASRPRRPPPVRAPKTRST